MSEPPPRPFVFASPLAAAADQRLRGLDATANELLHQLRPTMEDRVSSAYAEGYTAATAEFAQLPASGRLQAIRMRRREIDRQRAAHLAQLNELDRMETDIARRHRVIAAAREVLEISKNPRLQRLTETGFHKCMTAFSDGSGMYPSADGSGLPTDEWEESVNQAFASSDPVCFVVEHDWAQALEKAQEFSDGEIYFPFDNAVFEFRFSGHRVCFSVIAQPSEPGERKLQSMMFVETSSGWFLAAGYDRSGTLLSEHETNWAAGVQPIALAIDRQIRAIIIALEAEVAESTVVRAPHKLNAKREKSGKLPIFDYHVVSLARRLRHVPAEIDHCDDHETARKRMHFVRGHWRHYPTHKAWIKWHLRGDPDLGFIDKHYRL